MSFFDRDPFAYAATEGLDVVEPKSNEVFIDLDDELSDQWLKQMSEVLEKNDEPIQFDKSTVSKGGNKHVYLRFAGRELTDIERIALQACLGPDRHRELLSLLRIWNKVPQPPTLFFEGQLKQAAKWPEVAR